MLARETVRLGNGHSWQVYSGGAGPALLWLHGLTGIAEDDPVAVALAQTYSVIAPVAPGFTDLEELSEIDNIHDLALAYDDLLGGLPLAPTIIVGHSFGAMVAAEIAAHCPGRVEILALLSPLGLWNEAYPVADIFAVPPTQMDDLLWHDGAARDAFRARRAAAAEKQSLADQLITVMRGLSAVTKFTWPIPDKGLRKRLPRITASTLVLFGAEDRFVPRRYAGDFRAGLRHGETAIIPGAGHMVPYEKTGEIVGLVNRLVKGARR